MLLQVLIVFPQRQLDLSPDTPDTLVMMLEPQAFLSVLHNLVDNALHYVHDGGRIKVKIRPVATGVRLSVADNGPAIAPEHAALGFERFHRVLQTSASGSGLGLAISRRAATRLGGTVELSAGLDGKGCCFALLFPSVPAAHH